MYRFSTPFPEKSKIEASSKKMKAERSALFNHAIRAYKRLKVRGYAWAGGDRFEPDIIVANATFSVDKQMVLNAFVSQCLTLDPHALSPLQVIYKMPTTNSALSTNKSRCWRPFSPGIVCRIAQFGGTHKNRESTPRLPRNSVEGKLKSNRIPFHGSYTI